MRRTMTVLAAAAAVFAASAPVAAADQVAGGQHYRCEGDATWRISWAHETYLQATVTIDTGQATGTGCERMTAALADDGSVTTGEQTYGSTVRATVLLHGAGTVGFPFFAFTGIARQVGASAQGPFAIFNDVLNASMTYVSPEGEAAVARHEGIAGCGEACYTTRTVWTGVAGDS